MLEVIFNKFPDILFIPIAIGAVLGVLVGAVMGWRRRSAWYLSLVLALFVMVSWRVAIQILSGRYAAVLIFPAVIFTAYFIVKSDFLAGFIPKFPECIRKHLPMLFVIGLVIGSIGQLLHFNPYADHVIKTAALIREDAKKFPDSQILATDYWRLSFYSGLPVHVINSISVTEEEYLAEIGNALKQSSMFSGGVYYAVFPVSLKHSPQYYLSEVPEFIRNEMTLLGEFYHNRKKRRGTRVYRYDLHRAFAFSSNPAGKVKNPDKKIRTFSFEKAYPANAGFYEREQKKFAALGERVQMPELKNFPDSWNASGTGGYVPGSNGQLGIITLPDGKNVFHLKSDSLIAAYCLRGVRAGNYRMKITVSGVPGSSFALGGHFYAKSPLAYNIYPQMKLPDSGVWEFWLTQKYIYPGADTMRVALLLHHGEIFVHSIELYELDEQK